MIKKETVFYSLDGKIMHISTVNSKNNINLSVTSDVKVIDENKIIISVNEMSNTQLSINYNPSIVLTVFDKD